METLNIPTTHERLRQRYLDGEITLSQAAEEFCKAGFDNYVDIKSTAKRFNLTPEERTNCTPLKYAITARVDWWEYKEQLLQQIKQAISGEVQCLPDDERNPYTSTLFELRKLLHWVNALEYSKVAQYEFENYGGDAFQDCLIEPQDYVSSVACAKFFVQMLVEQFKMYTFHPDDGFTHTESPEEGHTYISESDARWLSDVVIQCIWICESKGYDFYDIAFEMLMSSIMLDPKMKVSSNNS